MEMLFSHVPVYECSGERESKEYSAFSSISGKLPQPFAFPPHPPPHRHLPVHPHIPRPCLLDHFLPTHISHRKMNLYPAGSIFQRPAEIWTDHEGAGSLLLCRTGGRKNRDAVLVMERAGQETDGGKRKGNAGGGPV